MAVIHIKNTEQFKKEVLEFDGISVVDFWAERCGPCRMLGPIIDELAHDNENKPIRIVKVNVEENPELAETFAVASIPVVFIIQNGKTADRIIGANPKNIYQSKIDELMASK